MVFQRMRIPMRSNLSMTWRSGKVRKGKFVFIGRDLPRQVLLDRLEQCVAKVDSGVDHVQ